VTDTTEPFDVLAYPPAQAAKVTGAQSYPHQESHSRERADRPKGRARHSDRACRAATLARQLADDWPPTRCGLIPEKRDPAARFPWRDRRAHRALQKAYIMHTDTKSGSQIQGLPLFDWRAAIVHKPATRAGNLVARRYRVHPAFADLVANLAGLGSEASSK